MKNPNSHIFPFGPMTQNTEDLFRAFEPFTTPLIGKKMFRNSFIYFFTCFMFSGFLSGSCKKGFSCDHFIQ